MCSVVLLAGIQGGHGWREQFNMGMALIDALLKIRCAIYIHCSELRKQLYTHGVVTPFSELIHQFENGGTGLPLLFNAIEGMNLPVIVYGGRVLNSTDGVSADLRWLEQQGATNVILLSPNQRSFDVVSNWIAAHPQLPDGWHVVTSVDALMAKLEELEAARVAA